MTQLHFNYKDIFRALRLGFSAKKIFMMTLGLIIAMVGYSIVSYIAFLAAGWSFLDIWTEFRLLPMPETLPWYSWIIWIIGALYVLCVVLVTGTAISKVTFEQLKGDDFYQISKAFQHTFRNIKAIIFSPAMVILFILAIVITGLILSLIGAIPYFGEIFTSIFMIPAFAASLFIVYLLIILLFTLFFAPALIGTSGTDTFDTLFEVFSMVNEQPARLIWYSIITWFLTKVGVTLLTIFSRLAVNIGINILSVFMGGKIIDVVYNAASTFKLTIPYWWPEPCALLAEKSITFLAGSQIFTPPTYVSSNAAILIASVLTAITYYILILFVAGFGLTIWFCGTTASYLVIAKKKDDRNLLEIKEEPIETAPQAASSETTTETKT